MKVLSSNNLSRWISRTIMRILNWRKILTSTKRKCSRWSYNSTPSNTNPTTRKLNTPTQTWSILKAITPWMDLLMRAPSEHQMLPNLLSKLLFFQKVFNECRIDRIEGIRSERPLNTTKSDNNNAMHSESLSAQLLKQKDEEIKELNLKNGLLMDKITSLKVNSIVNIKREESMNHMI